MSFRHVCRRILISSIIPRVNCRAFYNVFHYRNYNLTIGRFFSGDKKLDNADVDLGKESVYESLLEELKNSAKLTGNETMDTELDTLVHVDDRSWDFLDTIEIIVKLEERFGVTLDDSVCNNIKTLSDVVKSFEETLSKK